MRVRQIIIFLLIASALLVGCTPVNTRISGASLQPSAALSPAFTLTPGNQAASTTAVPLGSATPTLQFNQPSGLGGSDFDQFVEASYRQLLSRDPETVVELGLAQVYDTPTDQLTDISDEYIRQTQALESQILDQLRQYDRASLTEDQQLTYDIYQWWLDDRVRGHAFIYDDYPLNPTVFSVHLDLLQYFTDLYPLTNLQQAQDYVTCLAQVDTKFNQLIDGLKRREQNGVVLPRFLVNYILGGVSQIADSSPTTTPYYTALESKLKPLSNISPSEQAQLLSDAKDAITNHVLPGYQSLADYLAHLQSVATNDAGIWKIKDGQAYYAYILRHYTTTDMSADEIHQLGLTELDSIHAEMQVIFDQLGYPSNESLPELYERVASDSGVLTGEAIVQGYEDIITKADQNLGEAFDLRPSIGVQVIGGPTGGYYQPPAVDGSRPGYFYAQDTGVQPRFSMLTLAYHEAIPGHHFQIAIAQQLDLPSFRRGSDFTAYVEGWALYAEHLVKELGFYDGDPYGDLGRLQAQAFRAARLVVDTGIHAQKWSFDQAVDFMVQNTGVPAGNMQSEVSRYISIPGQATAYYIGYAKIMQERQRVQDALGDQFDLKEFHNILLGSGAMPLQTLDEVITRYIKSK